MAQIDEDGDVLADTIPADLLAMTGADIRWLFASGYGEGPIAVYDRRFAVMRIVYEAEDGEVYAQAVKSRDEDGTALLDVTAASDADLTEYMVWVPTRVGLDFVRAALPARVNPYGAPALYETRAALNAHDERDG